MRIPYDIVLVSYSFSELETNPISLKRMFDTYPLTFSPDSEILNSSSACTDYNFSST